MGKGTNIFRRIANCFYSAMDKLLYLKPLAVAIELSITAGLMIGLVLLVYFVNIPNPNMILITGLVICTSLFGWPAGILSTLIMIGYSMFFFSTDHSFFNFNETNIQKLTVIIIGSVLCATFVSLVKATIRRRRIMMNKEQENLMSISKTDSLTGVKNRYAYKEEIDSHLNKDIVLALFDLDNFKDVNDSLGHSGGDMALVTFADSLLKMFGEGNVYRFGGDEFVVVMENETKADFTDKLKDLKQVLDSFGEVPIHFSCGFVSGNMKDKIELREALTKSDELLYEAKRNGKDCFKYSKM